MIVILGEIELHVNHVEHDDNYAFNQDELLTQINANIMKKVDE